MSGQLDLFDAIASGGRQHRPWHAPPIDLRLLSLLERDGRSPFGGEDHDDAQVQAIARETMAGLVVALLDVRALDDRQRGGRHGFRTRAQYDAFVHAYPAARQRQLDGYEATLAGLRGLGLLRTRYLRPRSAAPGERPRIARRAAAMFRARVALSSSPSVPDAAAVLAGAVCPERLRTCPRPAAPTMAGRDIGANVPSRSAGRAILFRAVPKARAAVRPLLAAMPRAAEAPQVQGYHQPAAGRCGRRASVQPGSCTANGWQERPGRASERVMPH